MEPEQPVRVAVEQLPYNLGHGAAWVGCCGYGGWFTQEDVTVRDVPFKVSLAEQDVVGAGRSAAQTVEIPIGKKIRAVHLLVAGGWGGGCDTAFPAALRYVEGPSQSVSPPLRFPPWDGQCEDKAFSWGAGGLFYRVFDNPYPEHEVEALVLGPSPAVQAVIAAVTVDEAR